MRGAWRGVAIGLALALLAGTPALGQEQEDAFVFQGRGWGHGVGMPQYGARVLDEQHKWGYDQILNYYYEGTGLGSLDQLLPADHFLQAHSDPLWIGLLQHQTEVRLQATFGSLKLFQRINGLGIQVGTLSPTSGEVAFRVLGGGQCRFFLGAQQLGPEGQGDCVASVLTDESGTRFSIPQLPVGKQEYPLPQSGGLRIRPNDQDAPPGGFHVSLQIGMELYLNGLGEIPSSWGLQVRKSQAVAGRTYAARKAIERETLARQVSYEPGFTDARKNVCWCHLYGTVLDQNYVGWGKQAEQGGELWVEAVSATAGQVATTSALSDYFGIIQAFYFSSSGGWTENSEDVFSSALPYLRSKEDPYSIDPAANNKFASWEAPKFVSEIAAALADLGFASVSQVNLVDPPPGAKLEFVGEDAGGQVISKTLTGAQVRSRLGLRSGFVTGIVKLTENPFTDIAGSLHESDILTIWRADITQGCWADRYCPNDPVSRWQMAVFLVRALGLSTEGHPNAFPDDDGHPFEGHINAVAAAGITTGYPDGTFKPDGLVDRSQMAGFLLRALGVLVEEDHSSSEHAGPWQPVFSDVPDGQWYSGLVVHLAEHGITLGCNAEGTRYCPLDPVTRAQMASFLVRAFGLS